MTICGSGQSDPRCPADTEERDHEGGLETIHTNGPLTVLQPERFYRVQAQNTNGHYFPSGEEWPTDPEQRELLGRTIHVCTPPDCEPAPSTTQAACTATGMPVSCGGSAGGDWQQPPRSLEHCKGLDPHSNVCEETPLFFESDPETASGLPFLIFVTEEDPELFVQTRLTAVHCTDETGWDAAGSDELVVHFAGLEPPNWRDLDELGASMRTITMDIDDGNRKRPNSIVSNQSVRLEQDELNEHLILIGEDDDISWEGVTLIAVSAIVGGVGGGAGASAAGATALTIGLASGAGAAGGGIGSALTVYLGEIPQPDDFIGRAAWQTNLEEVSSRGLLLHDEQSTSVSPGGEDIITPGVDAEPLPGFTSQNLDRSLVSRTPPSIPAWIPSHTT